MTIRLISLRSKQVSLLAILLAVALFTEQLHASQGSGRLDAPENEVVLEELDRERYRIFEEDLQRGIYAFYRAEWDTARTVFQTLQNRNSDDLRPHFFEAMLPFWKYFFAGEDSQDALDFLEKSEQAIQVGIRRIEAVPDDTTTLLMMGGLYGYRGLVAASERQFRTALQSGASGLNYTRLLMNMSAENPDALIGQGMFHYMVGSIPREVRWLTSLFGLKGDRQTGIDLLEQASRKSSHTSTDASMMLVYIYKRDEQYDDAVRVSTQLVASWPDNPIFKFYHANALELSGKTDESLVLYEDIVRSAHHELPEMREMSLQRIKHIAEQNN